jgi:clan AA aspartic protease (TIGR02281 family)
MPKGISSPVAINGEPVEFMLDTGATDVAIPADLAKRLKLEEGFGVTLSTANGLSQGYRTKIDRLQLGDIVLRTSAHWWRRGCMAIRCCSA